MAEKLKDDDVRIDHATKEDMAAVAEMIQELADFEEMPDGPKLTVEDLVRDGFESSPPLFRCLVARVGSSPAGYALYFPSYSTWRGRAMMLEDLYVRPVHRQHGVGKKLFQAVAKEAHSSGCCRMDFHVLEWNPATEFYRRRGAVDLSAAESWRCYRLEGAALDSAAAAAGATE